MVTVIVIWRSMYRLPHEVTPDQVTLRCGLLKRCQFRPDNIASVTRTAGEKLPAGAAYRAYILRPGQMLITFNSPVEVKGWFSAKSYPAVQFDADTPDEFIAAVGVAAETAPKRTGQGVSFI